MPAQTRQIPGWLKVAATVGCAVMFSYIAFKALVGLMALGVAGALCLFSFKLGPVLAEYLDNLRMKLLKQQWLESPIPTLQNQSVRYHEQKETKKKKLEEILGKLETVKGKYEAYSRKYPLDLGEIEKNSKLYFKAKAKVDMMINEFKLLVKNVDLFDKEVEKATDKWEIALAVRDFDLAGDFNNDPMELIRSRTALSSVEDAVNKSMASLDTSLLEDLTVDSQVIDITPLPVKIPVRMPIK